MFPHFPPNHTERTLNKKLQTKPSRRNPEEKTQKTKLTEDKTTVDKALQIKIKNQELQLFDCS